jgi:hypothetical protein
MICTTAQIAANEHGHSTHTALINTPITTILAPTSPAPIHAVHTTNDEPTPSYDRPLVPEVAALKSDLTLANISKQLVSMKSSWKTTRTEPFPESIQQMFGQLRIAVEMRDIETVRMAVPMWGVQVAEENAGEISDEKKQKDEE